MYEDDEDMDQYDSGSWDYDRYVADMVEAAEAEAQKPGKGSSKPAKPRKAVGGTYDASLDGKRLESLLEAVERVMADGQWHTLAGIRESAGQGSETGIGARLRELRQQGHTVDRRRVPGASGLWEYRLVTSKSKPFRFE
jgi:hypothetical protein